MQLSEEIQKKIVSLYVEKKFSMVQISKEIKISPTTVLYYLKKNKVKRRSIGEAINSINFTKFGKKPFELKKCFLRKDQDLKLAGVMLYWGEGAKKHSSVNFTNSNPEMVKIFLEFLRKICGVSESRLKAIIHIYPDHDKEKLEKFWIDITKIPRSNFYPSHLHLGKKGTYKRKSEYGTIAVSYSDKLLLGKILDWIEDYKLELVGRSK